MATAVDLQKLMLCSWHDTLVSVRQVTRRHTGRKTRDRDEPGVPDDDERRRRLDGPGEDLADLNRAIKLHPTDAYALSSRGQIYLAMGRYDQDSGHSGPDRPGAHRRRRRQRQVRADHPDIQMAVPVAARQVFCHIGGCAHGPWTSSSR
jgi:hypothetical protein